MLAPYKESSDRDVRRAAFEADGKFFDEHRAEFDDLFDKLVKVRTKIAHELGYENLSSSVTTVSAETVTVPSRLQSSERQSQGTLFPLSQKLRNFRESA